MPSLGRSRYEAHACTAWYSLHLPAHEPRCGLCLTRTLTLYLQEYPKADIGDRLAGLFHDPERCERGPANYQEQCWGDEDNEEDRCCLGGVLACRLKDSAHPYGRKDGPNQ